MQRFQGDPVLSTHPWPLCTVRSCHARVTMLARYTDNQGRPLKQRELCDRHAAWLKANRPNVRSDPDA